MSVKKSVQSALAAPMSRREFLAKTAALGLVLAGVPAILKALTDSTARHEPKGYGASAYGGVSAVRRPRV